MWITAETIIGDIIDCDPGCTQVFSSYGMQCVDCPASRGESVEEACQVHGVNLPELLAKLNARLQSK